MNIAQINPEKYQDITLLVGRVLLVAVYFLGGFGLLSGSIPIEYAASKGMPAFMVWIGYTIKLFGGFAVILGLITRLAVFGLILFTLGTAFIFHPYPDPLFMKELSMIGGLLVLLGIGAGRFSVDYLINKRRNG